MLRVHCVQLFYNNLSGPGVEDLLYEVESVRWFAGLRLTGLLPDETTILHLRHYLPERHGPGSVLFGEINAHLAFSVQWTASLARRIRTKRGAPKKQPQSSWLLDQTAGLWKPPARCGPNGPATPPIPERFKHNGDVEDANRDGNDRQSAWQAPRVGTRRRLK